MIEKELRFESQSIPDLVISNGIDSAYLVGEQLHELRGNPVILHKPKYMTQVPREAITTRGRFSPSFAYYTTQTPTGIAQGISKPNLGIYNTNLLPIIYAKTEEELDKVTKGLHVYMEDNALLFSDDVEECLNEFEAKIGKERNKFRARVIPDNSMFSKYIRGIENKLYDCIKAQLSDTNIQPFFREERNAA